jgi:hypothetical protein
MYRDADGPRNLPGILQQLALEAIAKDRAFSVGDVAGPRGELRAGATLEALYVAVPNYLPDSFQVLRRDTEEPIVFAWLVPISATEASFARAEGRDRFEAALQECNPDLLDFARSSIV